MDLHFQILCAFSEFERSLISERTKESLNRIKNQDIKLGRPKGSKDSKPRSVSGYYLREASKKKSSDEGNGIFKSIGSYI
jgi:DNA invertase Pin-like site-specific DNA recombinase